VINQVDAIEKKFFKPKLSRGLTVNTLRTVWQKLSQNVLKLNVVDLILRVAAPLVEDFEGSQWSFPLTPIPPNWG
jgi:hypothetical protein